jgi:hypothetical protein
MNVQISSLVCWLSGSVKFPCKPTPMAKGKTYASRWEPSASWTALRLGNWLCAQATAAKEIDRVSVMSNTAKAAFRSRFIPLQKVCRRYLSYSVNYCTKGKTLYQKTFLTAAAYSVVSLVNQNGGNPNTEEKTEETAACPLRTASGRRSNPKRG